MTRQEINNTQSSDLQKDLEKTMHELSMARQEINDTKAQVLESEDSTSAQHKAMMDSAHTNLEQTQWSLSQAQSELQQQCAEAQEIHRLLHTAKEEAAERSISMLTAQDKLHAAQEELTAAREEIGNKEI